MLKGSLAPKSQLEEATLNGNSANFEQSIALSKDTFHGQIGNNALRSTVVLADAESQLHDTAGTSLEGVDINRHDEELNSRLKIGQQLQNRDSGIVYVINEVVEKTNGNFTYLLEGSDGSTFTLPASRLADALSGPRGAWSLVG